MADIYASPKEIKIPSLSFRKIEEYNESVKTYIEELKKYLNKLGYNEPETGEIIRFPVADGYAEYMIASVKHARLIHLEIGDAWSFQYAHLLGKKEIMEELERERAFRKLFSK